MLIDAANLFSRKEPVSKEAFGSAIQDMSSEEKDSLLWVLLQQRNSDMEKLQAMRQDKFGASSEKAQTLFDHLFNETETVEEIEEQTVWWMKQYRICRQIFMSKRRNRDLEYGVFRESYRIPGLFFRIDGFDLTLIKKTW